MGFTDITELIPGESTQVENITIHAVPGFVGSNPYKFDPNMSTVGVPYKVEAQNGYVFSIKHEKLLFEPHGDAHYELK